MARKRNEPISADILKDFLNTQRALFAQTNTKRLFFTLTGNAVIETKGEYDNWDKAKQHGTYNQPFTALDIYNDLP